MKKLMLLCRKKNIGLKTIYKKLQGLILKLSSLQLKAESARTRWNMLWVFFRQGRNLYERLWSNCVIIFIKKNCVIISKFKFNGYVYIEYDYFVTWCDKKNTKFSNILTTWQQAWQSNDPLLHNFVNSRCKVRREVEEIGIIVYTKENTDLGTEYKKMHGVVLKFPSLQPTTRKRPKKHN